MKKTLTIAIVLLTYIAASAQGVDDASLYSQTFYQGTAKALGMGNALGAVGGDMTAININPASMGIYRSNEITMSVNLLDNYHKSNYYRTEKEGNQMRFSIPNVGFVGVKERSNYRGLRFTQFGIGLTRTNDFNMFTNAKGIKPELMVTPNMNCKTRFLTTSILPGGPISSTFMKTSLDHIMSAPCHRATSGKAKNAVTEDVPKPGLLPEAPTTTSVSSSASALTWHTPSDLAPRCSKKAALKAQKPTSTNGALPGIYGKWS